jgi:aromatase
MDARTDNSIIIDAPLDLVWESMNAVERWPQLFSEYASAEILARDGDTVRFRLTTYPDPEYNDQVWSWVSERTPDHETYTSQAHRIETGPFEFMNINWSFAAVEDGTEMRWRQHFAMKNPADNEAWEQGINENTRIQMQVIKERIEEAARAAHV